MPPGPGMSCTATGTVLPRATRLCRCGNLSAQGRQKLGYTQVSPWQVLRLYPHHSHLSAYWFCSAEHTLAGPTRHRCPKGSLLSTPCLPILQQMLPAAQKKGLWVRKHRVKTSLVHRKRNVWPYQQAMHDGSLADGLIMYPLLIQAPHHTLQAKQTAELCIGSLDVLGGKMKLPHSLYPGWAFPAQKHNKYIHAVPGCPTPTGSPSVQDSWWSFQEVCGICVRRVSLRTSQMCA